MGLTKEQRIVSLLVIDAIFFVIELGTGKYCAKCGELVSCGLMP